MLSSFGSFSFYFVIFLGFVLLTQASINSSPFVKCTLPSPILHEHICIYVNMLCLISVSWYFLCILALVPVPCCPYVPLTLYPPSSVAGSFCIYRDDDETEDTNTFAGSWGGYTFLPHFCCFCCFAHWLKLVSYSSWITVWSLLRPVVFHITAFNGPLFLKYPAPKKVCFLASIS